MAVILLCEFLTRLSITCPHIYERAISLLKNEIPTKMIYVEDPPAPKLFLPFILSCKYSYCLGIGVKHSLTSRCTEIIVLKDDNFKSVALSEWQHFSFQFPLSLWSSPGTRMGSMAKQWFSIALQRVILCLQLCGNSQKVWSCSNCLLHAKHTICFQYLSF